MEYSELLESSTITERPPEDDTQPISKAELGREMYLQDSKNNPELAQHNLKLFVGPEFAEIIIAQADAERQFRVIVEGLQIEYKGRVNGLVDLVSDSRFISAKEELTRIVGRVRAEEVLHDIFT